LLGPRLRTSIGYQQQEWEQPDRQDDRVDNSGNIKLRERCNWMCTWTTHDDLSLILRYIWRAQ